MGDAEDEKPTNETWRSQISIACLLLAHVLYWGGVIALYRDNSNCLLLVIPLLLRIQIYENGANLFVKCSLLVY